MLSAENRLSPPHSSLVHSPLATVFKQAHLDATVGHGGRTITCGFAYLQRIKFGGQIHMWQSGKNPNPAAFDHLDWASIRQVEILQESSDQTIESLEVEEGMRSMKEMATMRAGGVRIVLISAGITHPPKDINDQRTFDTLLRGRLRGMDRVMWLDEMSHNATEEIKLEKSALTERLPHLFTTLDAARMFNKQNALPCNDATRLLNAVGRICGSENLEHDVMIGLKSPRADTFLGREFGRLSERKYLGFIGALQATYAHFGLETTTQMRGYGDHISPNSGLGRLTSLDAQYGTPYPMLALA